ncbi:hypothetical protein DFH94DRAFT_857220 [Russula ochroleuca]|uniref:Uncharacterized protein n=1 Tax=Russula ochroleuca TaxID=152965 RepID=A0A9P5MNH2_9AGAM|nr:hypothetical protein DFH94DRAFT_857220 [Russula ochroleuca]
MTQTQDAARLQHSREDARIGIETVVEEEGTTFKDKNALITGVNKGSIDAKTLKGSKQDVEALVDHIYTTLDLDYVISFTVILENCCELDGLDDKSELAQCIMLQVSFVSSLNHGPPKARVNIFYLVGAVISIARVKPVWGDLSGAFGLIADLIRIRVNVTKRLSVIAHDNAVGVKFPLRVPKLPGAHTLKSLSHLRDPIDLDKVVDISGFGEVGLWGYSRTQWETELEGDRTLEHFDGHLKDGILRVGWVGVKTGDPVDDKDAIREKVVQTIEELDWYKCNALKTMWEGERPDDYGKGITPEIVAGGKLYNIVVANEHMGKDLLKRGGIKKRVFIALNEICPFKLSAEHTAKHVEPGKVWPAIKLVGYGLPR